MARSKTAVNAANAHGAKQVPAKVDPISEAVHQWDEHGLGALKHMEATTAVMRIQQILVARIDLELQRFDVTFPQYEALVLLYFSREGSLPLGRMGRRLMVHPATVTNTIDQLERKGLVRREPHAADRRSVLATITPAGRKVARKASDALVEARFGIADMTDTEAERIATTIRAFRKRISDYA
jgi:DNA-binding MarR family transcriptional regulator